MTKLLATTIVCSVLIAASMEQSFAASAGSVETRIVDLTNAANGAARTAGAVRQGEVNPVSGMAFVDLTDGATPTRLRQTVGAKAPRTHAVDLTSGAPVPDLSTLEDEPDAAPDTIVITADRLSDPYEETNRGRFAGHVWLHRSIIDPVERIYIYVVPSPARYGVHNFFFNLETPSVLANDLFQGDIGRAGDTVARFLVNTTLGLGGLIDVAGKTGMHYRDNDFGATLANYGVSDAPYLLVPIIGPSNPRDLGGKAVDFFLDPLRYVTLPGGILTSVGRTGVHELDKRSMDVGELDALAKTAADPYAEERAMARKRRAGEISGP